MTSSFQYNPALDGLRAVAALLVVGSHCRVPGFGAGYFGVDLFFVLSGFLITRLLVDECDAHGRIDLRAFYLRRILRLGPPLLLLLTAYLAIAPSVWTMFRPWEHIRDVALTGLYLSDYARAFWDMPQVLQHSWSLSVEEHYYLLLPLAILPLMLMRIEFRYRVTVLLIAYVLATAWRIFEYRHLGWETTYYRFDTRMAGLIAGTLLGLCLPRIKPLSNRAANAVGGVAAAALIVCLAMGSWQAPGALVWMMTTVEVAAVGLLISASVPGSWVSAMLSTRPLVSIGVISYGVYLWHYPAAVFFKSLPWDQTLLVVLVFALSMARFSYVLIEQPLQQYRRSLRARWHATDTAASAPS